MLEGKHLMALLFFLSFFFFFFFFLLEGTRFPKILAAYIHTVKSLSRKTDVEDVLQRCISVWLAI